MRRGAGESERLAVAHAVAHFLVRRRRSATGHRDRAGVSVRRARGGTDARDAPEADAAAVRGRAGLPRAPTTARVETSVGRGAEAVRRAYGRAGCAAEPGAALVALRRPAV